MLRAALALLLATVSTSSDPDDSLDQFVRKNFADKLLPADKITYESALVDLNGDKQPEALVRLTNQFFCGSGGCNLFVFTPDDDGWREVSRSTITRTPIRVLRTRNHGWRDLAVQVSGGGILPGYEARLRFDGRRYPLNPSIPPAEPLAPGTPGKIVIQGGV